MYSVKLLELKNITRNMLDNAIIKTEMPINKNGNITITEMP